MQLLYSVLSCSCTPHIKSKKEISYPGVKRKQRQAAKGAQSDTSTAREASVCGTCSKKLDDSHIGCDRCGTWVHGSVMCLGLP